MTKKELYEMSFDDAIGELIYETEYITTYGDLKEFAKEQIDSDNLFLAIHILEAINNTYAQYYNYDYSMGAMETPTPLETLEDLEAFCEGE